MQVGCNSAERHSSWNNISWISRTSLSIKNTGSTQYMLLHSQCLSVGEVVNSAQEKGTMLLVALRTRVSHLKTGLCLREKIQDN